ncbi:MAG: pilus assembly protein [Pseudomonadota bacterium]|nr:pilus assembly protein [Pseudomonadota bacterium]
MSAPPLPPRRRARRGSQAIEFALVTPVFLALITGVMDYSYYFSRDASFRHVVHRAARVAASTSLEDDPEAAFATALADGLTSGGFSSGSVDASATVVGTAGERFLEVAATLPWGGLTGLIPQPSALETRIRPRLEDQEFFDTGG